MDKKLQLIQEEVARINQISEYDNSVGSTKTLNNDLSKIVIHHTKQQSKSMLTESVSNNKDVDFNLNNIFATMDGNYLIVDGQVVDLKEGENKGHILDNDCRLYLEIAQSQRNTLYGEGLYESAFTLNKTILQISQRLMEQGKINLNEWSIGGLTDYLVPDFIASPDDVDRANKKVKKYASEKYDDAVKFASDTWEDVKEYAGDGVDWIKDTANSAWEWTKESFLAILAKGFIWIAQSLEAALFSVAGIVVDVVLGFTGYGAIPMMVLWGIVGVYRIYVWIKEGGWMNFLLVICCLMGMLPGGAVLAKVFRGGASLLKGVTSTSVAASKLSKAFKPSQVNWLGKVAVGIKSLLGYVFKGLTWLTKNVLGFSGIAGKMGNFGAKIGAKLDKLLMAMGKPVAVSSTTLKVVSGGVLGYEITKAFTDGMDLENIKEMELALYDEYTNTGTKGYEGVGEPFEKISQLKGDFEVRASDDSPKKLTWIPKTGSPHYKEMLKHPFFTGYEMIESEPYGADPIVWAINKCSTKYGCPAGYEIVDGKVVEVDLSKEQSFTQEDIDGYEAAADAYVEAEIEREKLNN